GRSPIKRLTPPPPLIKRASPRRRQVGLLAYRVTRINEPIINPLRVPRTPLALRRAVNLVADAVEDPESLSNGRERVRYAILIIVLKKFKKAIKEVYDRLWTCNYYEWSFKDLQRHRNTLAIINYLCDKHELTKANLFKALSKPVPFICRYTFDRYAQKRFNEVRIEQAQLLKETCESCALTFDSWGKTGDRIAEVFSVFLGDNIKEIETIEISRGFIIQTTIFVSLKVTHKAYINDLVYKLIYKTLRCGTRADAKALVNQVVEGNTVFPPVLVTLSVIIKVRTFVLFIIGSDERRK
ncbi:hypothetical protein DL95DRAFT_389358, partial [Leptodontidium sp. 2 PMI_412]